MRPVNLVLSGGYIKVLAFVRALRVFQEAGALRTVRNIAGTSAGAVVGYLIALGYTPEEIETWVLSADNPIARIFAGADMQLSNVIDALETLGVIDTVCFEPVLREAAMRKLGVSSLTFLELSKRVGVNLIVTAVNITRGTLEYLCVDNTPHMDVSLAIRSTCAVPVIFRPVIHPNGHVYVDGGVLNNFPMSVFTTVPNDPQTLGLWIEDPPNSPERGEGGVGVPLVRHMLDVVLCMIHHQDRNAAMYHGPSVCRVPVPNVPPLEALSCEPSKLHELLEAGQRAANAYLERADRERVAKANDS